MLFSRPDLDRFFFANLLAALLHFSSAWSAPAGIDPAGFAGIDGGNAGVPAFSFLKLPVSARNIGLGARTLTTDEEATLIHGNPAGLALVEDYYYALSHAEILGEFRHEDLAFTWPTLEWGSFGAAANILSATAFSDARDIDENPSNPSAYDMALSLAYGHGLWDNRLAAGGRLDLIRSNIDGTVANGYAFSADLLFFLVHDLRLAVAVENLSHGVRYNSPGAPLEPLPVNVGLELGKPLLDTRWSAHAGVQQSNEGILHYYGGAEILIKKYLVLRAGYDGSSQDRALGNWGGLAGGIGIKLDHITLDYGYKNLGPLGDYHAFTLNYSRKAKFNARDEIYLEQAQEEYHKGKYVKALALAKKAVAVNPYNYKALALAQKLQLEIDRMDETAVALVYSGNTDGNTASAWKDGHALGGLARRKTKLLELKGAQGKSVILDAGNLTSPLTIMGQEKYVYGAYAQMPYDALNLGAGELLMGADKLDPRLPWLSSQKPLSEGHVGLLKEKTVSLKRATIKILGAAEPASIRAEALGGKELEAVAEAVHRQAGPEKIAGGQPGAGRAGSFMPGFGKPPQILVLLLHGSLASAVKLAEKAPELDVIILAGEAEALGSPMKAGNALICSPGRGGTMIGDLTLVLNRYGRIRSFRHFLIPLDASIPEDPQLKKFLEPVTVDPNQITLSDQDDDYKSQVLAYINSSDSTGDNLHLRDLGTGHDYTIAAGDLSCSRPLLGFGKNKVAFEGEDSAGAREIYAFEPGLGRMDTLTRMGGRAGEARWILGNNALLTVYARGAASELYRVDPWSREIRDLTKGKFGKVIGFDIAKTGDRLAINSASDTGSSIWVTSSELEAPVSVARGRAFLGSPRWNAKGDKLAFLAQPVGTGTGGAAGNSGNENGEAPSEEESGELRIFDLTTNQLIPATTQSRVHQFAWSQDGKRIFYSAGVNLLDLNEFKLDSLVQRKLTKGGNEGPRSEENPTPKRYRDHDGLLFESAVENRRRILWLDLATKEEKVLVDSLDYNFLR